MLWKSLCLFRIWISFVLRVAADNCEIFSGNRLSAWQIAKKALWDRVRGASLEISMQEGALMQLSVEVEGIPGAAQDCPIGMLALQLFLLDMLRVLPKSSQQTEIASWFEKLINQAIFQTQWSEVIRSGWPIFGLLARLSQLSQPYDLDRNIWQRVRPVGPLVPIDEVQVELQDAINLELAASDSSLLLVKNFFSTASTALWTDISSQGQEYILKDCASTDGQLDGIAYYFLSHLRTEFAGFAGPVDPFLRTILELSNIRHLKLSCWDVGAAPVPRNVKAGEQRKDVEHPEWDVWQICHHYGLDTRAFEPSEMGFQRLHASAASLDQSLQIHRLAVSNITGQAQFNRGGQVTGSLGRRGCGLVAFGIAQLTKSQWMLRFKGFGWFRVSNQQQMDPNGNFIHYKLNTPNGLWTLKRCVWITGGASSMRVTLHVWRLQQSPEMLSVLHAQLCNLIFYGSKLEETAHFQRAVGAPVSLKLSPMGIGSSQPAAASLVTGGSLWIKHMKLLGGRTCPDVC